MASVEPVLYGVLKIVWRDGHAALVDLRPVISDGAIFAFLRDDPANFAKVRIDEHGHRIVWIDGDGDEIDFGSDGLRKRAERQSEILRLAS
jgi:hypothetical protein